ncbi:MULTISPECIES: hypothetical protein [unclassified Janthinobacterium]|uniref:hypothetical protein n=1 Tax=unclassified Janthinobacterium TaxID=2610881 RepID=UPI001618B796|nr:MULTISPECIES: hypothetical protein [unclassified Janthinobacterium]MBB5606651.1 hypothetical protein [Janthinobacterium sp. S3T4]MBB5612299.1 hypothetical protein [Janthinobacterium sp. S3M3]
MATQSNEQNVVGDKVAGQAAMLLVLTLLCGPASAQVKWPVVTIPQGVQSFPVGGEITVNGLPLRAQGVLSAKMPAQVAELFRESLGQPLAEDSQGNKLVLGQALGEFYATVQLEPASNGTRGVVAVTRPGAAVGAMPTLKESGQRTLSRFPAGSRIVSQTSSVDGPRRSDFLTLSNNLGVPFNVEHIKRMLDAEGYISEGSASPTGSGNAASLQSARDGTTLFFKRRDAEAVAVVYRDSKGDTAIVLNTVTDMARAK